MKSNPRISFNADRHEYRVTNVFGVDLIMPSVTQLLKLGGAYPGKWAFKKSHSDRGTAVHLATQYYDEGDLDESSLAPEIVGYVEAYKKFRMQVPIKIMARELMVFSRTYQYAGTIDIVANVGGVWTIFDIKTGVPSKASPVQTAAYALALAEDHALVDEYNVASKIARAAIHLQKDGKYRIHKFENELDYEAWIGLLRWLRYLDKTIPLVSNGYEMSEDKEIEANG